MQLAFADSQTKPVGAKGCVVKRSVGSCIRSLTSRKSARRGRRFVDDAVAAHGSELGSLTLGTDNGSAFTSRRFRQRLGELGVTHRRGAATATLESQAFIESWFGNLKERLIWRSEFETLDQPRKEINAYIDSYHHRPHSGLRYRTPAEMRRRPAKPPLQA